MTIVALMLGVACLVAARLLFTYARSRRVQPSAGAERQVSDWTVLALISSVGLFGIALVALGVGAVHIARGSAPSPRELLVGATLLLGSVLFGVMGVAYLTKGGAYYDRSRSNPEQKIPTLRLWPGESSVWPHAVDPPTAIPGYVGAIFAMLLSGLLAFLGLATLF